jgi:hypothetical protein
VVFENKKTNFLVFVTDKVTKMKQLAHQYRYCATTTAALAAGTCTIKLFLLTVTSSPAAG